MKRTTVNSTFQNRKLSDERMSDKQVLHCTKIVKISCHFT